MAKIFLASKDVDPVGQHSYWVFDEDGNANTTGDQRIIRGGTTDPFDGTGRLRKLAYRRDL